MSERFAAGTDRDPARWTELRAQYANLQLSANRLAVRLGPRHPELLCRTRPSCAVRKQQIRTELSRIVASLQIDLSRAQQQERELSTELARLKVRQGDLRQRTRDTPRARTRSVGPASGLRDLPVGGRVKRGEQRQLNTANVSIISEAVPPLLAERRLAQLHQCGRAGSRLPLRRRVRRGAGCLGRHEPACAAAAARGCRRTSAGPRGSKVTSLDEDDEYDEIEPDLAP